MVEETPLPQRAHKFGNIFSLTFRQYFETPMLFQYQEGSCSKEIFGSAIKIIRGL